MSRSFVAWLLVTLGLGLLSVSVVLVPDSALADDGEDSCGSCTYEWDGMMWDLVSNTCLPNECECENPPNFPSGTYVGERRTADCVGVPEFCVACVCSASQLGQGCSTGGSYPSGFFCRTYCVCYDLGLGIFCA